MKEVQDIETLLTALYVVVDDHVIPREGKQPGRPKQPTDAELVCLAHPKLGEAEVAAELLAWARGGKTLPETVFLIGDKGFDGREWHRAMDELDIAFARPDKKNEQFKHGSLGGIRQRIEAIIDTLKDQLTLEEHGGRTTEGVFARIAARILALTAAIWNNWRTGQPVL